VNKVEKNKKILEDYQKKIIHTNFNEISEDLKNGVSPNLFSVTNRTDLVLESIVRKKLYMLERALDYGFRLTDQFNYLHSAIRTNDIKFVNLIEQEYNKLGKNIDEIDSDGNNLWHIIMESQEHPTEAILAYVVKTGASIGHKNKQGKTPINILLQLHFIVPNYFVELVKVDIGVLDLADSFGITGRNIIESFKSNKDWCRQENNQKLILLLKN